MRSKGAWIGWLLVWNHSSYLDSTSRDSHFFVTPCPTGVQSCPSLKDHHSLRFCIQIWWQSGLIMSSIETRSSFSWSPPSPYVQLLSPQQSYDWCETLEAPFPNHTFPPQRDIGGIEGALLPPPPPPPLHRTGSSSAKGTLVEWIHHVHRKLRYGYDWMWSLMGEVYSRSRAEGHRSWNIWFDDTLHFQGLCANLLRIRISG